MPGALLDQLTAFLQNTLGPEAWDQIANEVGARQAPLAEPDEISVVVAVAAEKTGTPASELLARFGESIVPDLLRVFGVFVNRSWTALDLLENTEAVIHRAVRLYDETARPPHLRITRPTHTRVVIHYASPRRLCAMAKGILRGIATHYGESFDVVETACMHTGATTCTLVVTTTS